MRRLMMAAMLALPGMGLGPASAQVPPASPPAPAAREAVVANDTDRSLQELYVFRPGAAQEGPDRLGANVLPPRATLRVALGRTRDCAFEVRAVFDGGEEMRRRVDVCRNARVAFADTGPRREVEVVNQTDQSLQELYLAPSGSRPRAPRPAQPRSGDWGADRLGSTTVAAGESFKLRLRGTQDCVFDIRAVFADEVEETRDRQDLCRSPRLAFGDAALPLREAVVTNRGRRTLRELYARTPGRDAWGADRLGAAMVEPRAEFHLRLRGRDCTYDLRAVFDDDREEVQRDLDLCAIQAIGFGMPVVTEGGPRRVTLVNGFDRTVQQVFLSPAEDRNWGEDGLGDAVLAPGGRHVVSLEGGCRADLRIVFETSAAEERRDIDICATTIIALRPGWTLDERLAPLAEGPAEAAAAPQPGSIRLRNAAGLPVVELYADPAGAASRGPDRLGRTVLGAGESIDFAPPDDLPAGPTRCLADLVAVFRDGRELRLPAADLCAGQEMVLQ
ncbi:MAG: hypothetical protein JWP04_1155 [Belnapia sp.]|nr:hypothetical protein [Belnapia sp.]